MKIIIKNNLKKIFEKINLIDLITKIHKKNEIFNKKQNLNQNFCKILITKFK